MICGSVLFAFFTPLVNYGCLVDFEYCRLTILFLCHRDIAAVQGSAPFFKKCVEKVRTSKKCPVCTRGFDSESDIDKVVSTVSV